MSLSPSAPNGDLGFVSLVGAGPGDPDLLTVKAVKRIRTADVIVYDRLVSQEILDLASPTAEMVYVGKQLDHHFVPQPDINQILVDQAKLGKHVVRLKGGDPFIFGRGGEELQSLAAENLPFEVVPGITAAVGCTAYAGIPLTHRDHAQSVQFITGHLKQHGEDIDWPSLAHSNHTLVFYMGLKQCPQIQANLVSNGLDDATPCAIIERGATPQQRVLTGKLAELAILAEQAISPSLIVVGSVTELHQELAWFTPEPY
ncbi:MULTISPECIES: uroporphyrinogen-III C-methyltransferase [unclassified Agarivorans]|uniref:uroporphyrinogen-III C-methyltransferase n=1 Tax=unclassified Agarivorans TaxID=2636026 RepID=UPI0026E36052|nr:MULTISPECIES: uroporphyrinogen-III C-methyltransferase [unclassified Agarivorans]MDO6685542.1 uroporphyrinogen-III C-methyltransferase [Agarivorans sp. 3_MG-2023]MDO6715928.1 uroporphyrinogen-III C-methyltransferase [Agarivorans sp. 2_MG-2023]